MFVEIDEMAVALERLLLIRLRDGSDLAIEVDQPRLLRVQLATALAASRAGEAAKPVEASERSEARERSDATEA